jgi:hypothetical protein
MTHPHHVTNKAVLQYLQLVYGFDADFFRRSIARLAETGIREGATGVIVEGVKLVIHDGRVIDVIERSKPSCFRRSRPANAILGDLVPTGPEVVAVRLVYPGAILIPAEDK